MTEVAAIVIIFGDKSYPIFAWYRENYLSKLIYN